MRRRIMSVCEILLFTNVFVGFRLASGAPNGCPTKQEFPSCENLRTSKGFIYHVPKMMLRPDDCEHGWYFLENGTFIVDSTASKRMLGFVVIVTPDNLTVSSCENLQWQIDCSNPVFICKINFTVFQLNKSATPDSLPRNVTCGGDKQDCNHKEDLNAGLPAWGTFLIVIGILGVVGLSVIVWKRCLQPGKGPNTDKMVCCSG